MTEQRIFDGDRAKLGEYVRQMADLMGLKDWEVKLSDEPPENAEHAACIDTRYGRKFANISVQAEWASEPPETFRATIVHELVHCFLNPARNCIDNVQSLVGELVYRPLYNSLTDHIEYATDGIAVAWAEFLPLPIMEVEEAA